MLRHTIWLGVLLLLPCPARAGDKPLLETWQAAYFEGLKVGHVHTHVAEVKTAASTRIRTTRKMELYVKRYGSVIPVRIEQTSDETAAGKVLALSLTQALAKDKKLTFTAEVQGDKLVLRSSADDSVRKLPWDGTALGLYAQELFFQKKKVKPGDKLHFVSYELLLPGPITVRSIVKDVEATDQLVGKTEGKLLKIVREPARLLRVDTLPDKIEVGGTTIQLPGKTVWLDAKRMPVREQFDMPGLGAITMYTTTKEAALKEGVAPELLPDLGLNISIPLKTTIEGPFRTTEAVYRVTLKEELAKVFASDERQTIRNARGKTFELVVKAIRAPGKDEKAAAPGAEYLQSNHFIDSDDARIQSLAKAVTKRETDPWRKALVLEKYVHDNMKVSTSVGFPTASQIAKDMEGDCRQHALLLAALCRAAGVPARTAVGLVYAREPGRSPVFGFHMWTEVWVRGRWVALDAILGQGGVAATHLKMADHHWAKTQTLAPLLGVARALGKIQIDIVSTK
jgi:hypothetical protein